MEFLVDQEWFGWFGGFGRNADIEDWLDAAARYEEADGWRMLSVSVERCWWLLLVPRTKVMLVMVRERRASG